MMNLVNFKYIIKHMFADDTHAPSSIKINEIKSNHINVTKRKIKNNYLPVELNNRKISKENGTVKNQI